MLSRECGNEPEGDSATGNHRWDGLFFGLSIFHKPKLGDPLISGTFLEASARLTAASSPYPQTPQPPRRPSRCRRLWARHLLHQLLASAGKLQPACGKRERERERERDKLFRVSCMFHVFGSHFCLILLWVSFFGSHFFWGAGVLVSSHAFGGDPPQSPRAPLPASRERAWICTWGTSTICSATMVIGTSGVPNFPKKFVGSPRGDHGRGGWGLEGGRGVWDRCGWEVVGGRGMDFGSLERGDRWWKGGGGAAWVDHFCTGR